MLKNILLFILLTLMLQADMDFRVENSNFSISQGSIVPNIDKRYEYNYDRLRVRGDYTQDNFFATFIGDGVNYYGKTYVNSKDFGYTQLQESDTPFKTKTHPHTYSNGVAFAKIYRAYGGYEDDKNRVVVGLQNISMGVGLVWNPTNTFNPRNTYAIEPDETFGVAGVSYTRHLNNTSHVRVVASQKEDKSFKYAGQYKAFIDFADIGIDIISSDTTKMLGYELEANLADTGIEVRSEGAYIKNRLYKDALHLQTEDVEFFQGIVGANYGFTNGISLVFEALYSSQDFSYEDILINYDSEILTKLVYSKFYTALNLSYTFNIFLDGSLTYIESFNDENSRFVSPTLTYTLNDYNSFILGAMLLGGKDTSEFGMLENTYFFKYTLSF